MAVAFYSSEPQGLMIADTGAVTMAGQSLFSSNYGDSGGTATGHSYGSPCWDPYPSSFFACAQPVAGSQLEYPTEEELLLGGDASEFLLQLAGCTPVMHPNLVSTLKNMVAPPPPSPPAAAFFEPQLQRRQQQHGDLGLGSLFLGQFHHHHLVAADGPNTVTVAAEAPPPLAAAAQQPPQVVEKSETEDDEIEAAVVSVDLIQNRRPFRCGHDGCNKTFKNPQTMKMHHKTHYTEGGAAAVGGLAPLPTLTSSLKAGHNKKIPSRCPKCKKTFVGLYELRRHYGRKHSEGEKPFGCRKCGKKFYIEVDVRDHEKLCGEPIECKCGLKFAFKCNLVAHKKAHPECQDQGSHLHVANNHSSSTTSSDESDQSRGSSPPTAVLSSRGPKRHREEAVSLHAPAPHFKGIVPDAAAEPEFKAARYGFSGLQLSMDGSSVWANNMHYPSANFLNFPMPTPLYSALGAVDQLDGGQNHHHDTNKLPHAGSFYEAFAAGDARHTSMGVTYNSNPLQGMVRLG